MDYEIMMNGNVKIRIDDTGNRSDNYDGKSFFKWLQREMASIFLTSSEILPQ